MRYRRRWRQRRSFVPTATGSECFVDGEPYGRRLVRKELSNDADAQFDRVRRSTSRAAAAAAASTAAAIVVGLGKSGNDYNDDDDDVDSDG